MGGDAPAVQGLRHPFPVTGQQARHFAQCVSNRLFQQVLFSVRRAMQHMIQHVAAVAGMADAQPQTGELVAAQLRDQIAQTIVAAMPTAPLQAHHPGRQIKIVMNDQDG